MLPRPEPPPEVDRAVIAKLADAIDAATTAGRRVRFEATASWYSAPKGSDVVDRDHPYSTSTELIACWGDETNLERLVQLSAEGSYAKVFADGMLYSVSLTEREGAVVATELHDMANIGLPLILQIDMPSALGGAGSMAEIVRTATPLSLVADEKRITYRFVPAGAQELIDRVSKERGVPSQPAWPYGVTVELAPTPRITELTIEIRMAGIPTPEGGTTERTVVTTWTVDDWQIVDGRMLGRTLRRRSNDPTSGKEILCVVRVVDAEPIPDDVPAPPIAPDGVRMRDDRRSFRFAIGSRDVTLEGRALRFAEPLRAHPGPRLEELARTAEVR
jgi:hypothetical protein